MQRTLPIGMKWRYPGNWSTRFWKHGQKKNQIFRIIKQAPGALKKPTNSWQKTVSTGGTSRSFLQVAGVPGCQHSRNFFENAPEPGTYSKFVESAIYL